MKTGSLSDIYEELSKGLPTFSDGRVDYTHARKSPVLSVVVYHDNEILLVKRSKEVGSHKEVWSGISGYIDEPRSVEDFVLQELREETAMTRDVIKALHFADPHHTKDTQGEKEWVVWPVLAELHYRPEIVLDWEHTHYGWVHPDRLHEYDVLDGFGETLALAFAAKRS